MNLEKQMFKMVSDWFTSKQSKREFLKDKAFSVHKFNYWIRKYRDQQEIQEFEGFKELEVPTAEKNKFSRKIEITTPSGFVLIIEEQC